MITFAVLGLGNRGSVYSNYIAKNKDAKIVSVCDVRHESLKQAAELYGVEKSELFLSEDKFFEKKRADVLIIATLDALHCRQTVKALSLGYDVLLEKPVAPTQAECNEIYAAAKRYGGDVVICHNLRYTPFYQKFKTLIKSGIIGDVLNVEQTENVAYHHYMCSFIRGKWHSEEETSPILLAKCCHDLDIISWLVEGKDESIQSFGALKYYTRAHKPAGTPDRCMDCKLKDCIYNAFEFSLKDPNTLCVPYGFDYSRESIAAFLSLKDNLYGQCVFACPNDMCDRQCVNISFDRGVKASLLMHGFSTYQTYRVTRVFGSKGKLSGRLEDGIIRVSLFDGTDKYIDVNGEIAKGSDHSGGDAKLVSDYISYKTTGVRALGISELKDSLQSHEIAFNADKLRKANALPPDEEIAAEGQTNECVKGRGIKQASGIYGEIKNFVLNGEAGEVQAVAATANYNKTELKQKVSADLAFLCALIGSPVYKYKVDISNEEYLHGFINAFFENGAVLRYTLTSSPLKNRAEISVFCPQANVYGDTESARVITRSGDYFAEQVEKKIEENSETNAEFACETGKNMLSSVLENL